MVQRHAAIESSYRTAGPSVDEGASTTVPASAIVETEALSGATACDCIVNTSSTYVPLMSHRDLRKAPDQLRNRIARRSHVLATQLAPDERNKLALRHPSQCA